MKYRPYSLFYLIFFLVLLPFISHGQSRKYKQTAIPSDSVKKPVVDTTTAEFQFQFKNINIIPYYFNEEELQQLKKLEKQKNYPELLTATQNYVLNFGIMNFYRDTAMLWKLGQLYERFQRHEEALFIYRLVLKHHRGDSRSIKRHYDTLNANNAENYVPLDYYYELVEYRRQADTLHPPANVFINMGYSINTRFNEYGPSMNSTSNVLYYSSNRTMRSVVYGNNEDIYFSKNEDGFWSDAEPLLDINTIYNEGSLCLSRDGNTMYFSRCNAPGGYGNCDLYMSKKDSTGRWTKPVNLGPQVNSIAWESHPSLSHSEDTLFFASDRIGGFGLSDIYITYKLPGGTWSKAQNLGPVINTRYHDVSPFMHPVSHVLYYSSTGHVFRFGEFDIYKSKSVRGMWQEPKNIGPLVNGDKSEYYFTIDYKSKDIFYARGMDEKLKNMDLFSFPLPMEGHPDAEIKLSGTLKDSVTGNPFKGIVSVIDMDEGTEVAPKFIRDDGSFEFDLVDKRRYLLVITGEDFFRIEKEINLDGDTAVHLTTPSIQFASLQFTSIVFEQGKADILPHMYNDLDKIFKYLFDNPRVNLSISGHTDTQGDSLANVDLSQRRADAIRAFLVDAGVDGDRVSAFGFGSSRPIIKKEMTEEDKKINRRVEFNIIKPE